ncbi:MAG: glycerol-3-phosphate 1-O-acyltransferase PlsY [Anaerovoracaceae bacterium]
MYNDTILIEIIMVVVAYLLGNISPSILLGKAKGVDVRKEGSGNAGTTNALRTMGKQAAVITLLIDILKGTGAVLLGQFIGGPMTGMLCVIAVCCGHVWPVFFGFKGGKGVATAFGAIMGLNPALGLIALVIVAIFTVISMRMSVGAMAGAATFPIVTHFLEPDFVYIGAILAIIILIKHRTNIIRLFKGEEPKISVKK